MAVSLSKGEKISLKKEGDGVGLKQVVMGLGWDVKQEKGLFWGTRPGAPVDLDASCVMFDKNKNVVDTVWFRQLKSRDGSVVHTGDNRTGAGEGDDEQIRVELDRVPSNVASLVFVVNSFTGQTFDRVENAFCRLVDALENKEIARFNLSCAGRHTAQIMAKVTRDGDQWSMEAIGQNGLGHTFDALMPAIQQVL